MIRTRHRAIITSRCRPRAYISQAVSPVICSNDRHNQWSMSLLQSTWYFPIENIAQLFSLESNGTLDKLGRRNITNRPLNIQIVRRDRQLRIHFEQGGWATRGNRLPSWMRMCTVNGREDRPTRIASQVYALRDVSFSSKGLHINMRLLLRCIRMNLTSVYQQFSRT